MVRVQAKRARLLFNHSVEIRLAPIAIVPLSARHRVESPYQVANRRPHLPGRIVPLGLAPTKLDRWPAARTVELRPVMPVRQRVLVRWRASAELPVNPQPEANPSQLVRRPVNRPTVASWWAEPS